MRNPNPEVELLIEVRTRVCTISLKFVRRNIHAEGERQHLL
jgi:hypothetical protein